MDVDVSFITQCFEVLSNATMSYVGGTTVNASLLHPRHSPSVDPPQLLLHLPVSQYQLVQAEQALAVPAVLLNVFGGHGVHVPAPEAENVPDGQLVHALAPTAATVPAEHKSQVCGPRPSAAEPTGM